MTCVMAKRLSALRARLQSAQFAAYIIPMGDAHLSEYTAPRDERIAFISGFTGSAGTCVVTANKALLWTDGRYFNQATKQLPEGWTLMKDRLPETPSIEAWLADNLEAGASVALDSAFNQVSFVAKVQETLGKERVKPQQESIIDELWGTDQPAMPDNAVEVHDEKIAGVSASSKLTRLRAEMETVKASCSVFVALDQIAWLLNLRGSDIDCNPVFFSYLAVTKDQAVLFVDEKKLGQAKGALDAAKVTVQPYSDVLSKLPSIFAQCKDGKIWMDTQECTWAVYALAMEHGTVLEKASCVTTWKAMKNPSELEGMRQAHIRDGVAKTKWLAWLKKVMSDPAEVAKHTECTIADKLEAFRREGAGFKMLSFPTISSFGPNGAVIHYSPEPNTCAKADANTVFLCDSGAQYTDGTTDVTRTQHFGTPTAHHKKCFTLVLKGVISLGTAVFPNRTPGPRIDAMARQHLWKYGLDYRHGTGHGVGAYLNVHEGPIAINQRMTPGLRSLTSGLDIGMCVSNEPGYYEDGAFGMRIENVMAVKAVETEHQFGGDQYVSFETLTMIPIQKTMMDLSLMTEEDIEWVDTYHAEVFAKLSPHMSGSDLEFLKEATAPLVTNGHGPDAKRRKVAA
eukprot:CAMPEP_0204347886 /NCGR_PEP_ID=MMETSP0469-20131031/28302_1 /ASSEMBLY_ACC=CAM_ASM_000384 /TAXON_ID=2969 /ORGANISM="Oxyrrhis marina" /LENGTH=624 /DNA_ID=CAMNT_0051333765 /DNA_START=35 /DNA_END=1909 /DNA_ORIENTATION=-